MSQLKHSLLYLDGRVHNLTGDTCWCGGQVDYGGPWPGTLIHKMETLGVEILPANLMLCDQGVVVRGDK